MASVTPFTNHGLIAGFPVPNRRNRLFDDDPVETTDAIFREIRSLYTTVPYGVGFCMAMSREVVHKIGVLNQQSFRELDGADIEWAMRAARAGYRNVMAENLYVKNDRFATDMLEGERMLSRKQEKILRHETPEYKEALEQFEQGDPLAEIRAYAFSRMVGTRSERRRIIFHQEGDPSADAYMRRYIDEKLKENEAVMTVEYSRTAQCYLAALEYDTFRMCFAFETMDQVLEMGEKITTRRVIMGSLYGFPKVEELMHRVRRFADAQGSRLVIMLLDHFCICPTGQLLNLKKQLCRKEQRNCELCRQKSKTGFAAESPESWLQTWKELFRDAQEILYYSEKLLSSVELIYGHLEKTHRMNRPGNYLMETGRQRKQKERINVLIPGPLTKENGLQYVRRMILQAERDRVNIRFFLRGECESSLGKLARAVPDKGDMALTSFLLKEDIDVCLIPDEKPDAIGARVAMAIESGLPAAGRNIGETGYLLDRYDKGKVLGEIPEKALYELMELTKKNALKTAPDRPGVLVVYEGRLPSGGIGGLEEQMWRHGIRTKVEALDSLLFRGAGKYRIILLDSIKYSRRLKMFVDDRIRNGCQIYYYLGRNVDVAPEDIQTCAAWCRAVMVENTHDRDMVRELLPEARICTIHRRKTMTNRNLMYSIMAEQQGRDRYHLYPGYGAMKRPAEACVVGWMHDGGKGTRFTLDQCMQVVAALEEVMEQYPHMRLLVSDRVMLDRDRLQLRERMIPVTDVSRRDRLLLLSQCDVILKPAAGKEERISNSEELAIMARIPVIKGDSRQIKEGLLTFMNRKEITVK
ncbi:MAG: hypothetical protein HUJ69_04805 [Lachnospiraceae bacterium]|nr:hypothetical protein [Lachnospiraceae bacterium]